MKVLVTYGSPRDGTDEIAAAIGDGLEQDGHEVDVLPAESIWGIEAWDAVVVGSPQTSHGWDRAARRFLKRHEEQLQVLQVWFFSNLTSDEKNTENLEDSPGFVRRWTKKLGALEHEIFYGDFDGPTDTDEIDRPNLDLARAWGFQVGEKLSRIPRAPQNVPAMPSLTQRVVRIVFIASSFLAGVSALVGALEVIIWPYATTRLAVSFEGLRDTVFGGAIVSGLLLAVLVALPNLAAGIWEIRRNHRAEITGVIGGGAMCIWMILEMVVLRTNTVLEFYYLGVGLLTMITAFWTWLGRNARLTSALSTAE